MRRTIAFFVCILIAAAMARADAAGTLDDIYKKVGRTDPKAQKADDMPSNGKGTIQIQGVNKGKISGWAGDGGAGTPLMPSIDIRFKIYKRGQVEVPYLACYLFDKDKKAIRKMTEYLELTPAGSQEPASKNVFTGSRTNTVQFVYPKDLNFKYVIAVVGNDTDGIYARSMSRNVSVNDFDFPEKKLLKGNKPPKPSK
ncbi:MAG TPA: hypothetical protein P5287_03405 [bacterium]|nr:hypothetical protein [bacterium]